VAHIDIRHIIGLLRFLVQLIAGRARLRLRFVCRELLFIIRRAIFAKPRLRVPANIRANPFAASGALLEKTFRFLDGFLKSLIVSLPAYGALNLVSSMSRLRKNAPEYVARRAQQPARHAGDRRLKSRHVSVVAFVAVKLELITSIRRQIVVIGSELYQSHNFLLIRSALAGLSRLNRGGKVFHRACGKACGKTGFHGCKPQIFGNLQHFAHILFKTLSHSKPCYFSI
jgi:hypothetical protein